MSLLDTIRSHQPPSATSSSTDDLSEQLSCRDVLTERHDWLLRGGSLLADVVKSSTPMNAVQSVLVTPGLTVIDDTTVPATDDSGVDLYERQGDQIVRYDGTCL